MRFGLGLLFCLIFSSLTYAQNKEQFSIVLELKTDKRSLLESVSVLDKNLASNVNILKLSSSLFGAYSPLDADKENLKKIIKRYYDVFPSAHIISLDSKEYDAQLILSGSEILKNENFYKEELAKTEFTKDFSTVIHFELGEAGLDEKAQERLEEISKQMGSKKHKIVIKGHTDSIRVKDERFDNMELSRQRAKHVQEEILILLNAKKKNEY